MTHKNLLIGGVLLSLAIGPGGCAGTPAAPVDNYSAGSITITNIPGTVKGQPAYKVYVYVTDSMSQHDAHKAQGTALLDGAASVTVQLYNPPAEYRGKDPDEYGEPWAGTGSYYSVIISPLDAPGKEAILVKAGQAFNRPNRECDFSRLMSISESSLFSGKTTAIYNEIIRADNQGIGADIVTPPSVVSKEKS